MLHIFSRVYLLYGPVLVSCLLVDKSPAFLLHVNKNDIRLAIKHFLVYML